MPELQFLKTMIFLRELFKGKKWVYFSIFSYLKFFSAFIINASTILFSKHGTIKAQKRSVIWVVCCWTDQNKYCDQVMSLEYLQKVYLFILSDVVGIQISIKGAAILSNL